MDMDMDMNVKFDIHGNSQYGCLCCGLKYLLVM